MPTKFKSCTRRNFLCLCSAKVTRPTKHPEKKIRTKRCLFICQKKSRPCFLFISLVSQKTPSPYHQEDRDAADKLQPRHVPTHESTVCVVILSVRLIPHRCRFHRLLSTWRALHWVPTPLIACKLWSKSQKGEQNSDGTACKQNSVVTQIIFYTNQCSNV